LSVEVDSTAIDEANVEETAALASASAGSKRVP